MENGVEAKNPATSILEFRQHETLLEALFFNQIYNKIGGYLFLQIITH